LSGYKPSKSTKPYRQEEKKAIRRMCKCIVEPFSLREVAKKAKRFVFQYIFRGSLVHSLPVLRALWKSTHSFFSYALFINNQTNDGENSTSPKVAEVIIDRVSGQGSTACVLVRLSVCFHSIALKPTDL